MGGECTVDIKVCRSARCFCSRNFWYLWKADAIDVAALVTRDGNMEMGTGDRYPRRLSLADPPYREIQLEAMLRRPNGITASGSSYVTRKRLNALIRLETKIMLVSKTIKQVTR